MRLFLATGNRHKVEEFSRLFEQLNLPVQVLSASAAGGMPEVEETEATFLGNARLKAAALRGKVGSGDWVLADDSGLHVDFLKGEPGVRSARYAGEGAGDAANRRLLLDRISEAAGPERTARFICVLVLAGPEGREEIFEGVCEGTIAREEKGDGGFGYDPIFVPQGQVRTFAEVDPLLKDELSHRGRALRNLAEWVSLSRATLRNPD